MVVKRTSFFVVAATFLACLASVVPWPDTTSLSLAGTSNPKVKPGNVNWYSNLEAACNASQQSGKPVLLFQLLGNLDDKYC